MAVDWDDVNTETWRPIPGSPGYEASSLGRIRSPWRVLKPWVGNKLGHLKVALGKGRRMWVHRAVCLAFYGPCPEGLEVRHLDGIPTNNRLENLRYGTHSENMQDRVRHGRQPPPPIWVRPLRAQCPRGHTYGEDRVCQQCRYVAKKNWVRKNVGVYLDCEVCGATISKLNLTKHKSTKKCKEGA